MQSDTAPEPAETRPAAYRITIYRDLTAARDVWRDMEAVCAGGPHDCHAWSSAWWDCAGRHLGGEPVIVAGHSAQGEPRFLLPLALRRSKGIAVLEWLASAHGNYSSGLMHPGMWRETHGHPGPAVMEAIRPHLPPADLIHLDAVPEILGDRPGPLTGLAMTDDGTPGFAFAIPQGCDDIVQHHLSKRARGNLRRCERRLDEQGDVQFRLVNAPDDIARAVEAMFSQKQAWCRQNGMPDFLASTGIRKFYETLLAAPGDGEACVAQLYVLELDGEIIATDFGMRFGDTLYGLISTITQGEVRRHSPGNVLFHRMAEHAMRHSVRVIDWGAGANQLKEVWCNVERKRAHAIMALTAKGAVAAALLRARLRGKAAIKTTPALWWVAGNLRLAKRELGLLAGALRRGLGLGSASRGLEA